MSDLVWGLNGDRAGNVGGAIKILTAAVDQQQFSGAQAAVCLFRHGMDDGAMGPDPTMPSKEMSRRALSSSEILRVPWQCRSQ